MAISIGLRADWIRGGASSPTTRQRSALWATFTSGIQIRNPGHRGRPKSTSCWNRAPPNGLQKLVPYYWRIRIMHEELPVIDTVRQLRYTAYRNTSEFSADRLGLVPAAAYTHHSKLASNKGAISYTTHPQHESVAHRTHLPVVSSSCRWLRETSAPLLR